MHRGGMSPSAIEVQGTVAPGFEAVRAAFARNFADHGEMGASFAVSVGEELVVDIWGGWADAEHTRPWQRDTITHLFSTTKGLTALMAHMAIERGLLELDAPVMRYWPEFAQQGKEHVLVRHVLDHRAGLVWLAPGRDARRLLDWDAACARLAETAPMYAPGTTTMYHPLSFGFLVGELIRRVTGRTPGAFLTEEITGPLGVDAWIGLPATQHGRCADVILPSWVDDEHPLLPGLHRADRLFNSPAWRSAEIPSVNGHGNARAVATVYGTLAAGGTRNGVRLVDAATVHRMAQRSGAEPGDGGFGDPNWAVGFMPNWGSFGPSPTAFGHTGFGGSFGMADPEHRVAAAYVMNRMNEGEEYDARAFALVDATYRSLPASRTVAR